MCARARSRYLGNARDKPSSTQTNVRQRLERFGNVENGDSLDSSFAFIIHGKNFLLVLPSPLDQ